jgi:hypothetical protein
MLFNKQWTMKGTKAAVCVYFTRPLSLASARLYGVDHCTWSGGQESRLLALI